MVRKLAAIIMAAAALAAGAAYGSEAVIRQGLQAKFPGETVQSIERTPFSGLYEVVLSGGDILYTDDKASFVVSGQLIDARGPQLRNLTRERSAQLNSRALRKANDQAIKRVRGNGKRVLYTFEDPNCGFCRELQKELLKITDITIYTFLWPILAPDSVEKSRAVWCSKDRGKAWDDLMSRGVVPQNDGKCETPIQKNMALAQRFGIRGTPALYLADGRMIGNYMTADRLEQFLNSPPSR